MVQDKGLHEEAADKIGTIVTRKGEPRAMLAELLKDSVFKGHAKAEATLGEIGRAHV